MKRILIVGLIIGISASLSAQSKIDGYPVANFAVTANVAQNGDMYGRILQNTGKLGEWLIDRGAVRFAITKNGKQASFATAFKQITVERAFPFVRSNYSKPTLTTTSMALTTFCPLAVNDAETSALPALMLEMTFISPKNDNFNIEASVPKDLRNEQFCISSTMVTPEGKALSSMFNVKGISLNDSTFSFNVNLKANEPLTLRIALTFFDKTWVSANYFANVLALSNFIHTQWSVLRDKTIDFDAAIPRTGDAELDSYLRWYMVPGIALTRYTRRGEVLTMGYCELNQRDSYWTTWLHLVFFKDIERRMIEESIEWQQPSGKIPTTILPLIERNDDIDINAFFILRAARYFAYYNDVQTVRKWWPALKNAMNWLISRDVYDDGLPAQISFWGDWKDVRGVDGRRYSPFSAGVYLAALKQMGTMSAVVGDKASASFYAAIYDNGHYSMNKPVEQGGLWNGQYYCQRWNDGTVNTHLLQDQTIGIFYRVIPDDRAKSIFEALNKQSLTPYGIAETTPYYPADWGYKPATYHNGAVWPWLSFMDCWARIRSGRTAEAIDLVKRVAKADLVNSGDWSPNEHINSQTGQNLGFQLQGWNAGLFGLVYFGLKHPGVLW